MGQLRYSAIMLGCISLLVLCGCAGIGPKTVTHDRLNYSSAVANSWQRMMLLNIVKIRYGDTPIFLEIASIVNQYALETELAAGAGIRAGGGILGNELIVEGGGRYADRPTITYSPLVGKKFFQSLMTPIPPAALLSLVQAGWNAKFLFRICVSAINGRFNSSSRAMFAREADPEFLRLLDIMEKIQAAGGLGTRVVGGEEGTKTVLFFRRDLEEDQMSNVDTFFKLLGLDPEASEFNIEYGSIAKDDKEFAILTRSMLDITAELAAHVNIPKRHIEENRASRGAFEMADELDEKRSHVGIQSSDENPDNAFVSIHYRDHWFYIDDRDYQSKRMFSFLLFLFTMAETGAPEKAPVLTIPAG